MSKIAIIAAAAAVASCSTSTAGAVRLATQAPVAASGSFGANLFRKILNCGGLKTDDAAAGCAVAEGNQMKNEEYWRLVDKCAREDASIACPFLSGAEQPRQLAFNGGKWVFPLQFGYDEQLKKVQDDAKRRQTFKKDVADAKLAAALGLAAKKAKKDEDDKIADLERKVGNDAKQPTATHSALIVGGIVASPFLLLAALFGARKLFGQEKRGGDDGDESGVRGAIAIKKSGSGAESDADSDCSTDDESDAESDEESSRGDAESSRLMREP
jgi:hypothetical protein